MVKRRESPLSLNNNFNFRKYMKKINYLAVSLLAAAFGFASCDDKNDCGCDCNRPIIDRVELTDGGTDSLGAKINLIDSTVSGGQTIAIFGENLGGIKSVAFVGVNTGIVKEAVLKSAFITDNIIVYKVPDLTEDCKAIYRTAACPDGFEMAPFAKVSPAKIAMVYNEFANDGDTLKIKGANFIGDDIKVIFYKDAECTEEIESPSVVRVSSDKLFAVIPEGVAESTIFTVETVAGRTNSSIKLRDRSNVLIDFDNNIEASLLKGSVLENGEAVQYPELFHKDGNKSYKAGKYGTFDIKAEEWGVIAYQPFHKEVAATGFVPAYPNVFGPYAEGIKNGEYSICDFTVKFEINVNESRPLQGEAYEVGFYDGGNDEAIVRQYCALFTFCEIVWDKTNEKWEAAEFKKFYTDGWMTVSVPFAEFLWNSASFSILTSPNNNCEKEDGAWGDEERLSYCAKYSSISRSTWGGIAIFSNPYSSGGNYVDGVIAIDNVRIVPDDKGGAYYPKNGYGVPERSF